MIDVLVRCVYCRESVNPASQTTWRRVIGWERKALAETRKSGSDIVLRTPFEEWACPVCISRLQAGLDIRQESLL